MGFLKIGLIALALYLIFVAKKSPARALGRSLGRFVAGVREGLTEEKHPAETEIQEARVLRKDIRE